MTTMRLGPSDATTRDVLARHSPATAFDRAMWWGSAWAYRVGRSWNARAADHGRRAWARVARVMEANERAEREQLARRIEALEGTAGAIACSICRQPAFAPQMRVGAVCGRSTPRAPGLPGCPGTLVPIVTRNGVIEEIAKFVDQHPALRHYPDTTAELVRAIRSLKRNADG